jgi:hypothetical protein
MADQIDSIIKLRRGVDAQRQGIVFDDGEVVYSTDIKRIFVGDGTTIGGTIIGNKNTIGTFPDYTGFQNDIYYDTTTNILYMLSSDAGPDNLDNYARITPSADDTTITFQNGVFSLNTDILNSYVKINGDIMTDYLTLHDYPISAMHAATKGYVDSGLSALSSTISIDAFDNRYLNITGGTITGNLTIQNELNVQTKTQLDTTLTVIGSSSFGRQVDFTENPIKRFRTEVKNVHLTVAQDTYQLQEYDTGSVIIVTSDDNGYISIPTGLPIGYNVLIVNRGTYSISMKSAQTINGVQLLNVFGKVTIGSTNGICNMVLIEEDKMLISGDLS